MELQKEDDLGTKIGIISEGPIDEALLPPILDEIARQRVGYINWPIIPDDLGEIFTFRKRGHGGVLVKVKSLIKLLSENSQNDHAFFIILLDRKTSSIQKEIKKLIQGKPLFVMGIAIEEIEAWWLADKRNLFEFLGITEKQCINTRFGKAHYRPETDNDPKKTLHELTEISPRLQETYGNGNTNLAREFAEDYWRGRVDLAAIEQKCPKGFASFCKDITQSLKSESSRQSVQ